MAQQQLSPGLLAQLDALTTGFKQQGNLGQLSPELLAYLTGMQSQDVGGSGLYRGFAAPDGRSIQQYGNYAQTNVGGSPEAQGFDYDPAKANWSGIDFMLNTDDSNVAATFDPTGKFIGYEQRQDDKDWKDVITFLALVAPAVAGVYGAAGSAAGEGGAVAGTGAGGGVGGGAGGASGAEALSGMDLAADAAIGSGNNVWTAGQGLSGASAGTSGLDAFRQGELNGYQTNGTMPSSAASTSGNMSAWDWAKVNAANSVGMGPGSENAVTGTSGGSANGVGKGFLSTAANALTGGNGDTLGGLLGAYLGYQDGKDKQETQSRDPWGPAQPYIKGLFSEGADLFGQYKAQPFSPTEQIAYGNLGNALDYANGNAPGLLSGFQANASGANQFVRGQRRGLIGASYDPATSPVAWRPGLLGDFGTGRK